MPLKQSPEYAAIAALVIGEEPLESWQEDDFHYFVFQLDVAGAVPLPEPPVAVFVMTPNPAALISAVTVTPIEGGEAEVVDLRDENAGYTAAYPL